MKRSVNGWICKVCGGKFPTRAELFKHKSDAGHKEGRKLHQVCKFCGQVMENIRKHNQVCEKRPRGPKRWTDSDKKRISENRKAYLKANPDKHPWKFKSKFKSIPCETLKARLRLDNFTFQEEFTDYHWSHSYSLDIAFSEKRLGIEVNGNQHYLRSGQLKPYYENRRQYLISEGWTIIELHYANCYKEEKIKEIEKYIREFN